MSIKIPPFNPEGKRVYIGDTRTFIYNGERFTATIEQDDWHERPWEASEGETVLRAERYDYRNKKRPHELIVWDGVRRYDDVYVLDLHEALKQAHEAWGIADRKQALDAIAKSVACSVAWLNDEWCWVHVDVRSHRTGETESLSGIESYTDYALSDDVVLNMAHQIQHTRREAWRKALTKARDRHRAADAEYRSWVVHASPPPMPWADVRNSLLGRLLRGV